MPTLDIEGRKVTVDDSFLKLSADDQHATVDEIAKSFAAAPKAAAKSSWSDFITDIPSEIGHAASENLDAIKKGLLPGSQMDQGTLERIGNTGKALLAVPGLIASPITGAARSLIGHPLAAAEHGIGTLINPEVAAKDDPAAMYQRAKGDVDTAMSGLASRGPIPAAAVAPVVDAGPGQTVVSAADRLTAGGNPVDVPRAIASDSMIAQRSGQAIRNIPIVGDAIPKATYKLGGQLEDAATNVASDLGAGSGPNVAHSIGQTIGTAAEQETTAARLAAQQGDQAVLAAWENSHRAANEAIAGREGSTLARARASVGDMSPQDMGETVIARLRAGEQEARATKDRLYGIAGESDGAINGEAMAGLRPRVAEALNQDGRVIDAALTPAANRMMEELNTASKRQNVNWGGPQTESVSMQAIETTRKRLNGLSQAATNDADRSAARRIMREFDGWLGDSFDNALFSGSDASLQSFRAARAANTEWRTRFGFNERDDADRVINRIVTGEVTPQEVANYVVGASKVGSKGVSSRLLTRIAEATAGDPEAMGAIRGGVWNRLSSAPEGVTPKAPAKVASDINEFLNGSGRDVANRLFSEPQRAIMRTYSQTLQQGAIARETVGEIAANTRPSPMEVGIGPLQKLANDVLGKSGSRSDEALYSAINSYAKSGSKGDINLLSRILQAIPEKDRGNLAASVVKNLGVSPRTGQFSPDVFVSSWGTYTPQAKSLLFGMSGPQRVALDDIAAISLRMKEIGSRFGNPSGTAQNRNFLALGATAMAAPLSTLAGAVGGAVAAKILASPVGAASVSKWSRAYEKAATIGTAATMITYRRASALLAANIQRDVGAPMKDIMLQLQGPIPAKAEDKNQ